MNIPSLLAVGGAGRGSAPPGAVAEPGAEREPAESGGAAARFASLLLSALAPLTRLPGSSEAPSTGEGEGAAGAAAGLAPGTVTADIVLAGDAAEIAAAGAPEIGRAYRGLDRLHPEFRARFDRVVERMNEEFGHKVEVVETFRAQARQDALFQQGRSEPGPVVTWTRSSNHTLGRAADVIIDGSFDNPAGYARLARIAQEEGLRTLGPRDPGHLELPGLGTAAPVRRTPVALGVPEAASGGGLAEPTVARVATVAQVARVAAPQVARVATVARPGAPVASDFRGAETVGAGAGGAEGGPTGAQRAETAAGVVSSLAGKRDDTSSDDSHSHSESGAGGEAALPETARGEAGVSGRGSTASARVEGVAAATGADAASRIARVLDLQAGLAEQPLSHMLLRIEGPTGVEDRIRVDLRGNSVSAALDMGSLGDAGQLTGRISDLQRALQQHGLEAESIRIRSSAAQEAAEMGRVVAAIADSDALRVAGRGGSELFNQERGSGGEPLPREKRQANPDGSERDPRGEQKEKDK